jgi:uncharacterized protein YbjT (DUF2867 family)
MILVTGAAGKTGRAVIRALAARGQPVRALVRRAEQVPSVEALGAQEAVVGDMRDQATVERAAQGARAIYHICPNVSPDELAMGQVVITAGQAQQVERLVYHSVLHPQTEAMPHHWLKLRVEEKLLESGLPCSILQPAAYMQNVLAQWEHIVQKGVYPVPYGGGTRLSMVDLEDVAAAAAIVLGEPGHVGATYELVGTQSMSQHDVAAVLSQQLGRPVRPERTPLEVWQRQARASGLGEYQVNTLLSMFRYYESYGFHGSPRVLGWLLGRPPTTFEAFVARQV